MYFRDRQICTKNKLDARETCTSQAWLWLLLITLRWYSSTLCDAQKAFTLMWLLPIRTMVKWLGDPTIMPERCTYGAISSITFVCQLLRSALERSFNFYAKLEWEPWHRSFSLVSSWHHFLFRLLYLVQTQLHSGWKKPTLEEAPATEEGTRKAKIILAQSSPQKILPSKEPTQKPLL